MNLHGTIIAKLVYGAGARGIHIVTRSTQLKSLKINQYILEKYIAGKKLRFLLLNDEVISIHRSDYGTSVVLDRPLHYTSYPQHDWDQASSKRIANALTLQFAAVDYLIDASGRVYILGVNTMPGLKWFHAPTSGPVVDVARLFLESLVDDVRQGQRITHGPQISNLSLADTELAGSTS